MGSQEWFPYDMDSCEDLSAITKKSLRAKSTLKRCTVLVIVLLLSTSASFSQDFYLDSKGVTIRCEDASLSDTVTVFDIEYLTVDDMLPILCRSDLKGDCK